ncbi:hypothetical protein O1611_g8973 [Lasiodiplodia mahajangana]|uniref:Uncharacterized protein n=1 Tax=Lasiodiplodia mahajangana TaxID=1108764 RepID=A0ACC2JB40_9PEZI|nr:hypothetical protein O1611_g8973 [Lasiodiplodia mahajangana]
MNDGLPQIHKDRLLRKEAYQHILHGVRDVDDVLVLICGHGGRDMRCGVMGPVLQAEFERQLPQAGVEVLHGPLIDESVSAPASSDATSLTRVYDGMDARDKAVIHQIMAEEGFKTVEEFIRMQGELLRDIQGNSHRGGEEQTHTARVGLISHIGGHKFAGNIIIYVPPTFKNNAGNLHPLAGHGVWYGRIEPKHVEGVIRETIIKGNIVTDHFRGAIKRNREILRL